LIGNVTRDPDIHTTQNGNVKASFSLAVQRRFANQQGVREVDFLPIVAWKQTAELVKNYVTKGKKLAVCGVIQVRSYDAQDGTKHTITEIIADEIEFLSPRQTGASETSAQAGVAEDGYQQADYSQMQQKDDDELPFERRVSLPGQKGE